MLDFSSVVKAWGSPDFQARFKAAVEQLSHGQLPLQQALAHTSSVSDEPFTAVVISCDADDDILYINAAIFFSGIVAGCSCADDPTPLEPQLENCLLQFDIDRQSGAASVKPID
jgi:hypothetical protein